MSVITTKNALETRATLRKKLFTDTPLTEDVVDPAIDKAKKEAEDFIGKKTPDPEVPKVEDAGTDVGKEGADDKVIKDPAPKAVTVDEGELPKPDEDGDWKSKFLKMERQFKSIQSAITPAQQKNARLEKEIETLRAQVAATEDKPKIDAKNLPEVMKTIREVFPEGADLLEDLYAKSQRVDKIAENEHLRSETDATESRNKVIAKLVAAHPDAQLLISEKPLWDWINSHDPGAVSYLENVVKEPWNHDPKLAIEIFDGYKRTLKAKSVEPVKPVKKVPTDIAPTEREMSGTNTLDLNGNQDVVWSEKDWAAARKEVNANTTPWERKKALQLEMRKQLTRR